MNWVILIGSGLFEAVWANALGRSEGFTKLWPSVIFFITLVISMAGLAWAMRTIPVGTAYAVWAGIGATTAVAWSMGTGQEPATVLKVLFVTMIVGGIGGWLEPLLLPGHYSAAESSWYSGPGSTT